MNDFDQFIFDDLKKEYARNDLSDEQLRELYYRFKGIGNLREAQPYIFAMRYLGIGTTKDPHVLKDLKASIGKRDYVLAGLYYDILLFKDEDNENVYQRMQEMVKRGYSDTYLKGKSHLRVRKKIVETPIKKEMLAIGRILFESKQYKGLVFTGGDITYIHAKVYIRPPKRTSSYKVVSQLLYKDKPYSEPITDEITITPSDTFFTTKGWGDTSHHYYRQGFYEWRITIDRKTYSQRFYVYEGTLEPRGVPLRKVRTYGGTRKDINNCNYSMVFERESLEYLYFHCFFDRPNKKCLVQFNRKIIYVKENILICDDYVIVQLNPSSASCRHGFGNSRDGDPLNPNFQSVYGFDSGKKWRWKRGTYTYQITCGTYEIKGKFRIE